MVGWGEAGVGGGVRERICAFESERGAVREGQRERERERERGVCVCVCVCVRARARTF